VTNSFRFSALLVLGASFVTAAICMVIRKFSKWGRALTKTITVLVLIAINLMPLAPVFAQVATDTSSGVDAPIDVSVPSTTPNAGKNSVPTTDSTASTDTSSPDTSSAPADAATTPTRVLSASAMSSGAGDPHSDDERNAVGSALLNYQLSPINADAGVRVVDVNGDGLPDVIQSFTSNTGVVTQNAYINTGNGLIASSTWNPPVSFVNYQQAPDGDYGVRIADVNVTVCQT
jgi:hypothetical protein